MTTDAVRFMHYKATGTFLPVTSFTGTDSVRAVLSENVKFPSSREDLIKNQGWKVVDLVGNKRVHLSEILSKIPEKMYSSLDEVVKVLEAC